MFKLLEEGEEQFVAGLREGRRISCQAMGFLVGCLWPITLPLFLGIITGIIVLVGSIMWQWWSRA